MKRDELEQVKKKELSELQHAVGDMKEKYAKLSFDLKSGKTAVLKDMRLLRKSIAVYHTCIHEKQNIEQK